MIKNVTSSSHFSLRYNHALSFLNCKNGGHYHRRQRERSERYGEIFGLVALQPVAPWPTDPVEAAKAMR